MLTAKNRNGGFSLTEFLVVIGIVSILAALAIPRVGATLASRERREAAKAVVGLLVTAQSAARATEKAHSVVITAPSGNNRGEARVFVRGADGSWLATENRVVLPRGMEVSPQQATFVFNSRGLLEQGAPAVRLEGKTLQVSRWGEVRLQ